MTGWLLLEIGHIPQSVFGAFQTSALIRKLVHQPAEIVIPVLLFRKRIHKNGGVLALKIVAKPRPVDVIRVGEYVVVGFYEIGV
jgi:hypothetical protein